MCCVRFSELLSQDGGKLERAYVAVPLLSPPLENGVLPATARPEAQSARSIHQLGKSHPLSDEHPNIQLAHALLVVEHEEPVRDHEDGVLGVLLLAERDKLGAPLGLELFGDWDGNLLVQVVVRAVFWRKRAGRAEVVQGRTLLLPQDPGRVRVNTLDRSIAQASSSRSGRVVPVLEVQHGVHRHELRVGSG